MSLQDHIQTEADFDKFTSRPAKLCETCGHKKGLHNLNNHGKLRRCYVVGCPCRAYLFNGDTLTLRDGLFGRESRA